MKLPLALATVSFLAACTGEPARTETTWTGVLDEDAFAELHELRDDAAPPLHGSDFALGDARAYLALPEGDGPHPGVVVIHEWWGLNDHIRHWADRLAADGYAAVAVDLYGGQVAETPERARELMQSVDGNRAHAILRRAHEFLAEDERIRAPQRGVIGWCFGGGWSLRHAITTSDELDAAVIYYGHLETDPEVLASIRAPILGIFGEQDEGIPPPAVNAFASALRQAVDAPGQTLQISMYDAGHAFANPSSARYVHEAATAAWGEVRDFFAAHLK